MKENWIISVEQSFEEIVKSKLQKLKIKILHELMEIGVFTIQCSKEEIDFVKKIPGVLSIEKEGEMSI
ncbi:MAG: hypothetical protein JST62_05615 [Bacteroidetes bacterium]|jgi:hypothetical protein|nr:hypothetical protein [Bacteroidota bacterium]